MSDICLATVAAALEPKIDVSEKYAFTVSN